MISLPEVDTGIFSLDGFLTTHCLRYLKGMFGVDLSHLPTHKPWWLSRLPDLAELGDGPRHIAEINRTYFPTVHQDLSPPQLLLPLRRSLLVIRCIDRVRQQVHQRRRPLAPTAAPTSPAAA